MLVTGKGGLWELGKAVEDSRAILEEMGFSSSEVEGVTKCWRYKVVDGSAQILKVIFSARIHKGKCPRPMDGGTFTS